MENVNGLRKGFVLDPQGNRLLPITHVNLVIGNNGETLSGTLKRITETVSILQKNGGVISIETKTELDNLNTANIRKGAICYVSTEDKYYSYSANGSWKPMQTSSSGGSDDGYSHIWVGPDPPANENMLWLDTNSDGVIEGEDDLNLLYNLRDKINEMQTEIEVLNSRVKYLEENGVAVDPKPPGPDEPTEDEDDIILLEDGSEILLEKDGSLLLEIQVVDEKPPVTTTNDAILMEDGIEILMEDGSLLLLEDRTTVDPIEDSITALYEATIETLSLSSKSLLQVSDKSLVINSNKVSVLNNNLIL